MKTEWQKELCSVLPQEFEQLNPDCYIQRRNIVKREATEETMGDPGYECDSRFISKDVYEVFMEQLESPAQTAIMSNLDTVQVNQQTGEVNNLVIMSALADIFELIGATSLPTE